MLRVCSFCCCTHAHIWWIWTARIDLCTTYLWCVIYYTTFWLIGNGVHHQPTNRLGNKMSALWGRGVMQKWGIVIIVMPIITLHTRSPFANRFNNPCTPQTIPSNRRRRLLVQHTRAKHGRAKPGRVTIIDVCCDCGWFLLLGISVHPQFPFNVVWCFMVVLCIGCWCVCVCVFLLHWSKCKWCVWVCAPCVWVRLSENVRNVW